MSRTLLRTELDCQTNLAGVQFPGKTALVMLSGSKANQDG